jgi:hypothetical protein
MLPLGNPRNARLRLLRARRALPASKSTKDLAGQRFKVGVSFDRVRYQR